MNNVVLIGRLTKDPELRYIPTTNTAVTTFMLAVDKGLSREKRMELEQKNQPTADFIPIVCWGKTAQNVANYLSKGLQVAVSGRIQTRSYDDNNGVRRYVTEVVAGQVEFLEWKDKGGPAAGQSSGYDTNDSFNDDFHGFEPRNDDNIPF